jgi:hypothetical protein
MCHQIPSDEKNIKQDYLVVPVLLKKMELLCISEPFGGSDVAGRQVTNAVKKRRQICNSIIHFLLTVYMLIITLWLPKY